MRWAPSKILDSPEKMSPTLTSETQTSTETLLRILVTSGSWQDGVV